jgi:hypothetical protein
VVFHTYNVLIETLLLFPGDIGMLIPKLFTQLQSLRFLLIFGNGR